MSLKFFRFYTCAKTAYPHFARFVDNPDIVHVGHLKLEVEMFSKLSNMSSLFVHSYNYYLNYLN